MEGSFLESRGVIEAAHRLSVLEEGLKILRTQDIAQMARRKLVIANAHKFGSTANVDMTQLPTDFDLVIVDEAHHYPAQTWRRIIDKFQHSRRIFLTATPFHRGM